MNKKIVFLDTEVGVADKIIHDIGAVCSDGAVFHASSLHDFVKFISGVGFVCGHNIIHHDLHCINTALGKDITITAVDTLYLSPLLFPTHPYHSLVKDDKLVTDELNNPVNDSKKAQKLFYDEVNAFNALPLFLKQIFCGLLYLRKEFKGFFDYVDFAPQRIQDDISNLIRSNFYGKICSNADVKAVLRNYPVEMAYALALIWADDEISITPPWIERTFPQIENVFKILRNTPCSAHCAYCKKALDIHSALSSIFNYDSFRLYNGEPLQERAVQAAVDGKSLLAVFPTGGGKSLTFQLPALMAAKAVHGLTVVISPLQSLMKDQVDNLGAQGITSAVTVNGMLDPVERANALERISNDSAHILYISPEQLRSRTIERLLINRNVIRFVIDEAHCFSAWGQDFRVDYLYIGDFIRELQSKKRTKERIPVSCFTATAKQKVISDIRDYFKRKLDLDLELFASNATRENLRYSVIHCETDDKKYNMLRNLISEKDCPTIVYVSRTRRTRELAERLSRDGFPARPFNGKMDANEKVINQEDFINNKIQVIVATSAFGMGVDKKDVQLVVHYDISSSLEDYVQEAGRAGRNPSLQADCYVLYNDNDLDKHFILLNQTKLSMSEIQQVWKAVKDLTRQRLSVCCSPLEIARQAGWNESGVDIETRVKTAIQALENAGYVKRGQNMPRVYATGIVSGSAIEAGKSIDQSSLFTDEERETAKRIIASLIGKSKRAEAGNDEAESRIDYLADMLGLTKKVVIHSVNQMRQAGILDDSQDMTAYIQASDTVNKSLQVLERYAKLERFLFSKFTEEGCELNLKNLNETAQASGLGYSSVRRIRTLLYFLTIKDYISKEENIRSGAVKIYPSDSLNQLRNKLDRRIDICHFVLERLFRMAADTASNQKEEKLVNFSLVGLFKEYKSTPNLVVNLNEVFLADVADAMLYLSKIGAIKLEGGFLVLYNAMEIKRIIKDNRIKYKVDDYRFLDEFYKQKIRQIHIVGEYANLMVKDYNAALKYVDDYFQIDHRKFIDKYFKGERKKEIDRNITPGKYSQLFENLSDIQEQIICDKESKYIVVAAGPGSGKTRVLVHKLAALLLMEDVKHDQLLMLTFSRAAATEFKKRLIELIGNAANFVDIKTFHSYCFDLLGKIGSLDNIANVEENATNMIMNGEVEPGKISKAVLVIDEAQDMSETDFNLVKALMQNNDDMHVIAVGDDDQNIYAFRGSDSNYLRQLVDTYGATKYEMPENYRSQKAIVALSNAFVSTMHNRMKSEPGVAVPIGNGKVVITFHKGNNFIEPLVNEIIKTHGSEKACVLTKTNDEAMQILCLLQKHGIHAKLIQSLGKQFRLNDLAEIRYFLSVIDQDKNVTIIPENIWTDAKTRLATDYSGSTCLEICENLISDFETVCPDRYRSDLDEFIKESQFEDFYRDDKEVIYVSTIHKAKGREFDTVYMLLQNVNNVTDEERRVLYVGMTRAKSSLYIHCNSTINNTVFKGVSLAGAKLLTDPVTYGMPNELLVQLTHKDVFLNFFKDKQAIINRLRSGNALFLNNYGNLCAQENGKLTPIVVFSKAFKASLAGWTAKGYSLVSAEIQFIVAWKGKEDDKETLIVLPCVKLIKKHVNLR